MAFSLPISVITPGDLARLDRELKSLDDFFVSAQARKSGTPIQPPRPSRLLEQTAQDNQLNLLEVKARTTIAGALGQINRAAPTLHISFATDPPSKTLEQVLAWLRSNVHPYTLLQVGLQPSIAAGCMLRTPNKVFDLSLRRHLDSQNDYLLQLIRGAVSG